MKLATIATTLCLCAAPALAQDHGGGMGDGDHHLHCPADAVPQPLLSVPDINGDGIVNKADKHALNQQRKLGYAAIMDLDADGDLDGNDVALVAQVQNDGLVSTAFDQQLVRVWHATKRYEDVDNAIADGFRPFTQELAGHGQHYARLPFLVTPEGGLDPSYENHNDENVDILVPEGLNYDENGKLVAVFYYHGINVRDWVFATDRTALVQQSMMMSLHEAMKPDVFENDDEFWHIHWGGCFSGLNYPKMQFDPTLTPNFTQPLTDQECGLFSGQDQGTTTPDVGWLPAFNMMHVWLYKLNPCGVFAGIHPHVSEDAMEEPHVTTFTDWCVKQFGPAPFCGADDGHGGH